MDRPLDANNKMHIGEIIAKMIVSKIYSQL